MKTLTIFFVDNNDMTPFVSKGDLVIYEPMRLGHRMANSIYVVEYRGKKMVARVQFLIAGGMRLIFDGVGRKTITFQAHEKMRVIFVGHVVGSISKHGKKTKRFSLYGN